MSQVVNLRGTGGAGKSTVVRRLMDLCGREPVMGARKRPLGYRCPHAHGVLFVPGHYDTPCGGCDTLKTVDEAYAAVHAAVDRGEDVVYEGIMVQDDVRRAALLAGLLASLGGALTVISLDTPLADCLAGITARRADRGNTAPLDPRNTTARAASQLNMRRRLAAAGVRVEVLGREAAFERARALLRLAPGAA